MNNLTEFGRAVAQRRLTRGLTQSELAEQAGLALSSLSRFESGRAGELGARKLLRLLEVLGLTVQLVEAGAAATFTLDEALAQRSRLATAEPTGRKRVRHAKGDSK